MVYFGKDGGSNLHKEGSPAMVRWSVKRIGGDGLVKVGHCFIVHPRRLEKTKGGTESFQQTRVLAERVGGREWDGKSERMGKKSEGV